MRLPGLALVLVVVGCGDDAAVPVDIHALGECDQTWKNNGFTECEAACKASLPALTASGTSCPAHTSAGPVSCSKTFQFEGVTGCCASSAITAQVLFGECD
jgi:hypothetical protein